MLFQFRRYNILALLTVLMLVVVSCHKGGEPEPNFEAQDSSVEETSTPLLRDGDSEGEEDDEGSDGGESVVGGDGDDDDDGGGTVVGGDGDDDDDDGGGAGVGGVTPLGAEVPEGGAGSGAGFSDIKK
jgi:hypothetical protein